MEHTDNKDKPTEIATVHVSDFPDYYDKYEGWFRFGFVIELKN